MTIHHFWFQSGPFASNNFFLRKPVNEPCFFYSCLFTCQKWKSDIDLLVKYWWFKNTEILLSESHFCLYWELDFSQACSFFSMLMNHKNFDFTQIPDKTKDVVFLKSPKTIFDHFYLMGIFSKKSSCHTQLYMDP